MPVRIATGVLFFGSGGDTCKNVWSLAPDVNYEIVVICAAGGPRYLVNRKKLQGLKA